MKRTFFVLLLPFLLGGCAQLFDSNLYTVLDPPPPLDKGALAKASVNDIQNMMDDTFLEQLQDDPAALAAAQEALGTAMLDPDATQAEAMEAAATLLELTEGGSGVADLKDNAINNLNSIGDAISAGNYAMALKLFMGDKSQAEIKATLDNLAIMAFTAEFMMMTAANLDGTVNSTIFFSGTDNPGNLAQSCLMGAIANALINDRGGTTTLAGILASATPTESNGGPDMTKFIAAKDASPPETFTIAAGTSAATPFYSYAYVAILKAELPVDF